MPAGPRRGPRQRAQRTLGRPPTTKTMAPARTPRTASPPSFGGPRATRRLRLRRRRRLLPGDARGVLRARRCGGR
eukprot:9502935-Pyramimonas_sp.AAC.1